MKRYTVLLFLLGALLFSCTQNTIPEEKGDLPVQINLEPALAYGIQVDRVQVVITKGEFTDDMDLTILGNNASGIFEDLAPGNYAIDVNVFADSVLIATGSGTGSVSPGDTTTVYITLQFVPGGLEVVVNWGLPYEASRRVLLVGNSHTYYNGGVDVHMQSLVDAVHPEWHVVVDAQTYGGYTLENHYNNQATLDAIAGGNWDLVVLQEASDRPMEDPDLFYQYSTLLSDYISQSGALTGFYMTWAWRNNPEMFIPTRDAYSYIGAYLDALVLPAGVAFYNANQDTLSFSLYAPDNYHPSLHGTYLAACVMLAGIWNVNPVGNTYIPLGISHSEALFLQNIAWSTVQAENSKKAAGKLLAANRFVHHFKPLPSEDPDLKYSAA
jgi:hypothetical protein